MKSRHQVSFYDAAYHALALIHNGTFVTAHSRYVNKATESGSVIQLLSAAASHAIIASSQYLV